MGSYYADSFDLDLIRTEGRNLLTVIGGGGGGLSGGCRWHTAKEEVITKTVSSPLDKDRYTLKQGLFFCGRVAISVSVWC